MAPLLNRRTSGTGPADTGSSGVRVALALILAQIAITLFSGWIAWYLLSGFLGQPAFPLLSPGIRLIGIGLLAGGVGCGASTLRHRPPQQMLRSTALTALKLLRRHPLDSREGRLEPFVVGGPYRFVRHPLYLGVTWCAFGLGLVASSAVLLLWGVALVGWFSLVLIPFEEAEMLQLFGGEYQAYRRHVPRLFPTGRRYR